MTAVARLQCARRTDDRQLGTAFLIDKRIAITAFHCIGDRSSGEISHARLELQFENGTTEGQVETGNPTLDYALIRLDEEPSTAPMATARVPPATTPFWAKGWPEGRPFTAHPMAISGTIVDPSARIFENVPAVQLFAHESAHGLDVHGMSGAPVMTNDPSGDSAATALIRWAPDPPSTGDMSGSASIYACPLDIALMGESMLASFSAGHGVYVAYAEDDRVTAEGVVKLFRKNGLRVTWRREFLSAGDSFQREGPKALDEHQLVFIIVTSQYKTCRHPMAIQERKMIRATAGPILPWLLEECSVPDFLKDIAPLDFPMNDTGSIPRQLVIGLIEFMEKYARTLSDGDMSGVGQNDTPLPKYDLPPLELPRSEDD